MRAIVKSNVKDLVPLVPLPSEDELRLLGGNYFVRPSDNRRLEYFVSGNTNESRAVVNLVTTNSTGLFYYQYRQNKISSLLQKFHTKLINISTAGVGPSEPYGDYLGQIDSETYLKKTCNDVIALLKYLGVKEVITMGISGGWEPSACLAEALLQAKNSEIQLRGVINIAGIPWQTQINDFWERTLGTGCGRWITMKIMESSVAPYMWYSLMIPTLLDPAKMKASMKNIDEVSASHGDVLDSMIENMGRANKYSLFVTTYLGQLTTSSIQSKLPEKYADLKRFHNVPVHLHLSSKDELVPTEKTKPWFMDQMPHAEHFDNGLSHVCIPFEESIERMLVLL